MTIVVRPDLDQQACKAMRLNHGSPSILFANCHQALAIDSQYSPALSKNDHGIDHCNFNA